MPDKTIKTKLNDLKVDTYIKKNINALEGFIEQNKSTKLSDLLSPNQAQSQKFSEIIKPFNSLDKVFSTIANGISRNNLDIEINELKEDIRKNYASINNEHKCFNELKKAKENLEREKQKKSDEQNESKIGETENTLKKYTILVLEEQIKKNNKNFEAAVKIYNLSSIHPLCIARYIWLKEQSKHSTQGLDYAKLSTRLIQEKINVEANADKTESSLLVEGDITLLDLRKIKDWNNFKLNFGKQLNELRSKKNETKVLVNETQDVLLQKNSGLLKEVIELKEKITSLETQLSVASNIEENKLIANNDNESASSNIEASSSRNQDNIIDLNSQLLHLTEENKILTNEVDTQQKLNNEQEQIILNLKTDLEKYKTELEIKEKQIAENLENLKQHKEQLASKESALIKSDRALEESTHKNRTLFKDLSDLSNKLDEKGQSLIKTESELNTLKIEHNQIQLQIEGLEGKLVQNTSYNDGIAKQKQEQISKLHNQLEFLKDKLKTTDASITKITNDNNRGILMLQEQILEKEALVVGLKNELQKALRESDESKNEITELKKESQKKELQLKTLTEQCKKLTIQRDELEKKHQTLTDEIAESNKTSQEKENELQSVRQQLEILKQNLKKAEEKEKDINNELAENALKIQTLEEAIKKLEPLYGTILQETEKNSALSVNLNLEKDKREKLEQQLNELSHEINVFCQTMKDNLEKLNPSPTIIPEGYNPAEMQISEAAQKVLPSSIHQSLTALVDNNEQNDIPSYDLAIDNLNLLKLQTISCLNMLINKSATKEQQLSVNKDSTAKLQKELQKSAEKIKELTKNIERLTQSHDNFDGDSDDDSEDNFLYDDFPVNNISTENIDTQQEIAHNQYLDKIFNELPEFKKIQYELQQKIEELNQLQGQLKYQREEFVAEIEALKKSSEEALSDLNAEKEKLNENLNAAQEALQRSKDEITELKSNQAELISNGSASKKETSKLASKIKLFEEQKESQENSIKELESKMEGKDKEIKDLEQHKQQTTIQLTDLQDTYAKNLEKLEKDLKTSSFQAIKLQNELAEKTENIEKLEEQKKLLAENLTTLNKELEKLNVELETTRENSKQIKDELTQVNESFTQSQKFTTELSGENKKLKNKIETLQKSDSDLSNKCDTLEETLNTKTKEIDDLKNTVDEIQQQLKFKKTEVKNLSQQITAFENNKQSLEKQLQELKDKENSVPIQNISPNVSPLTDLHLNNKNSEEINTTQPHSSSSSSPISSSTHTPSPSPEPFNFLIKQDPSSEDDSGFLASTHSNSTNSDLINFTNSIEGPPPTLIKGGMPMSFIQEQIDSFLSNSEFKNYLINRLAAEFEAAYVDAFKPLLKMTEYNEVDSATLLASKSESKQCNLLINDAVTRMLSNEATQKEIKNALTLFVSQAGQSSLSIEETAEKLLVEISNDNFGINQQTKENYNECYQILLQASKDNKSNAQQYVALLKLCGEQILSAEKKENAKSCIINNFKNGLNAIDVDPKEYREPIKNTASKLTTEILNLENMLEALEKAKVNILDSNDQLKETKNILNNQFNEKIKNIIEDNFAYIFIDRILDKINSGVRLSDDEIQKLPLQLQYADSVNDFELGLKALWPNLNYLKQSAVVDRTKCFLTARSLLRIKALAPLTHLNHEAFLEEISNCNAKAWLEKKLQLRTNKSIDLKLDLDQQKDLDNQFNKFFSVSPLEDMAVTLKSVEELTNELEKLHGLKVKATDRLYKIFADIETKLAAYPNLVDIREFEYYLNLKLAKEFSNQDKWKVTQNETKIILVAINKQLVNKWRLFAHADNELIEEIAKAISTNLALANNQFSELEDIKKLVTNALDTLCMFPNLKDTLEKRTKWQKEVQQLYAFAEKLRSFRGNKEIEDRKAILEAMQDLKQVDINNNPTQTNTEIPSAVYLPHSCSIVPNTDESYSSSYDVTINGDVFYKQNALKVGETLTFEQTLSNYEKQNWSVTRINDKRLAYKTHKPWKDMVNNIKNRIGCETSYAREISFAQMIHSVNSFKNANICTLNFGDCSADMKKKLYLFVQAYNELRHDNNGLLKGPRLLCHMKNPPDLDKKDIAAVKNEIKAKLKLNDDELVDTAEKLKDDTISRQIISRSRRGG